MAITDTQCILICTYLYAVLRLFYFHWWSLLLLKVKSVVIMFTEPHIGSDCLITQKMWIFSAFWRQDTVTFGCFCPIHPVFVPHMQSSRLVYHTHCEGLHVYLCKQASKVESIRLESGHCWINRRDAECDWLRGYDVTLWFETLMTGTGLEGSTSWKCRAALQRRH